MAGGATDTRVELTAGGLRLRVEGAGWHVSDDRLQLCALAPELSGSASRGAVATAWTLQLPLSTASCSKKVVEVPGLQSIEGVELSSERPAASSEPALSFDWCLLLALRPEGDGLLLRLQLKPQVSADVSRVVLQHISLAPMELWGPSLVRQVTRPTCWSMLWPRQSFQRSAEHSSFLVNGWQTFSFAGVLHGAERQPRCTLPFFSGAFHAGAAPDGELLGGRCQSLVSDLFGLLWLHEASGVATDGRSFNGGSSSSGAGESVQGGSARCRAGVLAGFLGQRSGLGGIVAHAEPTPPRLTVFSEVGAELRSGAAFATDWLLLRPLASSEDGLGDFGFAALQHYFQLFALHHRLPSPRPSPIGWCSWYCHGPQVNEELMMDSLKSLESMRTDGGLPLNLFQLDDGWQRCWGDWRYPHPKRFPNGIKPLATAVRQAGMLPGIWLAPAALTEESVVAKEHPEWLLRDDRGRPVRGGFTAPGFFMLALDTTHPGVLEHVRQVVRTIVAEWGFGYLKCDFLHCAALPGARRYDPTVPRAAALRLLMEAVREAAGPETFILACGAPLGPCAGLVDAARISADTADHWLPKGPDKPGTRWFFARDRTNLPGARNMVRNTLVRLPMHGRLWVNDPDCLILREEFSLPEARGLATVAFMSGGSLIFSDEVERLHPERLALLRVMVPPLPHAAQFVKLLAPEIPPFSVASLTPSAGAELLGPWHLAAIFNWTDSGEERDVEELLPKGIISEEAAEWHAFEFWEGRYWRCRGPQPAVAGRQIPARGCRLVALRAVRETAPQLVGSDLHLSCGLELEGWAPAERRVDFTLRPSHLLRGAHLWFFLPGATSEGVPPRLSSAGVPCASGVDPPLCVSAEAAVWRVAVPDSGTTSAPAGWLSSRSYRVEW